MIIKNNKKKMIALLGAAGITAAIAFWPPPSPPIVQEVTCNSYLLPSESKPCGENSIIVYNSDGSYPRYLCYMNDIDNNIAPTTHSVTGGIGFGDNYGNGFVTLNASNNEQIPPDLNDCIIVKNNLEEVVIEGDYFVTVPCKKLNIVSNISNIQYDNISDVGTLKLHSMIFQGNDLLLSENEYFTFQQDILIQTDEILNSSYYGRCVENFIQCQAIIRISSKFTLDSPMSLDIMDNDYSYVFYIEDVNNNFIDENHIHLPGDQETFQPNMDLLYYQTLKSDINNHASEHISIIPFKLCKSSAFDPLFDS